MMKSKLNKLVGLLLITSLLVTGCGSNRNDNSVNDPLGNIFSEGYNNSTDRSSDANVNNSYNNEVATEAYGNKYSSSIENDKPVSNDWWSASDDTDESYNNIRENIFKSVLNEPLSTFSIDVDTASYSNIRRYLQDGLLPPEDSIRIEEMINYFKYNHKEPKADNPIGITTEIGDCPWNDENKLVMIGLKAAEIPKESLPKSNVVLLLDVSGSMDDLDKLPLLKKAFKMLVEQLDENDRVSIVVYAGASGVVLSGTRGDDKEEIMYALDNLYAGGSTAGAEGILKAYELAEKYFIRGGNNRIILATDGDFNVGISSDDELIKLIEEKRESGVFLSVLGFGTGNLKDSKMESLADHGNGTYSYIDSVLEAKKVLVNELYSTLYTLAKDTKIQIEFNPVKVKEYRLIGYGNRLLNNKDFSDDSKDAGELGVGHTVTAFYEIVPYKDGESYSESGLKYQEIEVKPVQEWSKEWLEVRVRYKKPNKDNSDLIVHPVTDRSINIFESNDFKFASAVIEFGLILKDSEYKGEASFDSIIKRAKSAKGYDDDGYRAQFINLVEIAEALNWLLTPINYYGTLNVDRS